MTEAKIKTVPYPEMSKEMIKAGEAYLKKVSLRGKFDLPALFNWHDFYKAIVDAAEAEAEEPKQDKVKIPMKAVESSNIASIGYDAAKQKLAVGFKGGGLYTYNGVPAELYEEFLSAPSVGSFFHSNIRNAFDVEKQ